MDKPFTGQNDSPTAEQTDTPTSRLTDHYDYGSSVQYCSFPMDHCVSGTIDLSHTGSMDPYSSRAISPESMEHSPTRPLDLSVARPLDLSTTGPLALSTTRSLNISYDDPMDIAPTSPMNLSTPVPVNPPTVNLGDPSASCPMDLSAPVLTHISASGTTDSSTSNITEAIVGMQISETTKTALLNNQCLAKVMRESGSDFGEKEKELPPPPANMKVRDLLSLPTVHPSRNKKSKAQMSAGVVHTPSETICGIQALINRTVDEVLGSRETALRGQQPGEPVGVVRTPGESVGVVRTPEESVGVVRAPEKSVCVIRTSGESAGVVCTSGESAGEIRTSGESAGEIRTSGESAGVIRTSGESASGIQAPRKRPDRVIHNPYTFTDGYKFITGCSCLIKHVAACGCGAQLIGSCRCNILLLHKLRVKFKSDTTDGRIHDSDAYPSESQHSREIALSRSLSTSADKKFCYSIFECLEESEGVHESLNKYHNCLRKQRMANAGRNFKNRQFTLPDSYDLRYISETPSIIDPNLVITPSLPCSAPVSMVSSPNDMIDRTSHFSAPGALIQTHCEATWGFQIPSEDSWGFQIPREATWRFQTPTEATCGFQTHTEATGGFQTISETTGRFQTPSESIGGFQTQRKSVASSGRMDGHMSSTSLKESLSRGRNPRKENVKEDKYKKLDKYKKQDKDKKGKKDR